MLSVFYLFGLSTICCGGLPKYLFTKSKNHLFPLQGHHQQNHLHPRHLFHLQHHHITPPHHPNAHLHHPHFKHLSKYHPLPKQRPAGLQLSPNVRNKSGRYWKERFVLVNSYWTSRIVRYHFYSDIKRGAAESVIIF